MYKTLIVMDNENQVMDDKLVNVLSFEKYLRDYPLMNETRTRIINLCDTEQYLSRGYYCSLLAEARSHKVLPSVKTINDLRAYSDEKVQQIVSRDSLADINLEDFAEQHFVFFGQAEDERLQKLAKKLFQQYPAPILKITLIPEEDWFRLNVEHCSLAALDDQQHQRFVEALVEFTNTVWRTSVRRTRYRWDMAILVNPQEKVPPSSKEALSRFVRAAGKQGIQAELVSYDQVQNISRYDALFIRETTSINHYTYRLAVEAEKKGLVVIDDPTSILRCCNKVYLHDAFSYQGVPSPKTEVLSDASEASLDHIIATLGFPMVLKNPEGSFSSGVFKVEDRSALEKKLTTLLQETALVLVQEFLFTEYDWRIGVLNGRAIYACRYFMARNHWQIYNHEAKRYFSGGFETLPTFEVPKAVLDAGMKAARIIGDGLYGVDIKFCDNRAYVLEVNDNPSIDYKVEDGYLGDELYMQIMAEFLRRLEARGR